MAALRAPLALLVALLVAAAAAEPLGGGRGNEDAGSPTAAATAQQQAATSGPGTLSSALASACGDYTPPGPEDKWYSALGQSYDCSWYALYTNCQQFGGLHANFGRTAAEACCACQSLEQSSEAAQTWSPDAAGAPTVDSRYVANTLTFECTGTQEEVAQGLQEALLIIHGGEQGAMSTTLAPTAARRTSAARRASSETSWWQAAYQIAVDPGTADVHFAIAANVGTGTGLGQTSIIMATVFATQGLEFDKSSLSVGEPEFVIPATVTDTTGTTRTTWTRTSTSHSTTATARAATSTSTTAPAPSPQVPAWNLGVATTAPTAGNGGGGDAAGASTTSAACKDHVPREAEKWYDMSGPEFDCSWYESFNCPSLSIKSSFGLSAEQACCACGGGARGDEKLPWEVQATPAPTASLEKKNTSMFNEGDVHIVSMLVAGFAGFGVLVGCVVFCVVLARCPHLLKTEDQPPEADGNIGEEGRSTSRSSTRRSSGDSNFMRSSSIHTIGFSSGAIPTPTLEGPYGAGQDVMWWDAEAARRAHEARMYRQDGLYHGRAHQGFHGYPGGSHVSGEWDGQMEHPHYSW